MRPRTIHPTTTPILVTGGTGTLGRQVVARLLEAGHSVRVLGRHAPDRVERATISEDAVEFVSADLSTGRGVEAAVDGVDIIVHAAGTVKGDEDKARSLVAAASRAGVRHLAFISVVGADRIPVRNSLDRMMFGYFESKLAAERVIAESGVGWTTLRATQFHDLTLKTVEAMTKLPIVPVPAGWRLQPIDSGEVADRLVELALGAPAGLVPAIGGPRVYEMRELVRGYLEATNRRKPIVSLPLPGAANRAYREGANLAPDRAVGRRTWEEFLAERVGTASADPAPA